MYTARLLNGRYLRTAPAVSIAARSFSVSSAAWKPPSAAMLVIGDEILNGKTHDGNSYYLAKKLWPLGVSLDEVRVIHDDIPTIRRIAREMHEERDFVYTSGGIGCTHDDVTYEALADEFCNGERSLHGPTLERMDPFYASRGAAPVRTGDLPIDAPVADAAVAEVDPRLRMALLPHGCEVENTDGLWVPTAIVAGNIRVLPGVPSLFANMVDASTAPGTAIATASGGRFPNRRIVTTHLPESSIAEPLAELQDKLAGEVSLGSYPVKVEPDASGKVRYIVRVSVEGFTEDSVVSAAEEVARLFNGTVSTPSIDA